MMKIRGLDVTLESPTVDNVPWVYVKDVLTRLGDRYRTFSVRLQGVGHVGFISLADEGVKCEADFGPNFYPLVTQLRKEEAVPLVVHKWLELRLASKPKKPARKPRPTLKAGVEWIARNDSPTDNEDPASVAEYISSILLADLFGVDPEVVGQRVVKYRKDHPDCVDGTNG